MKLALLGIGFVLLAGAAQAGPIESACNASNRSKGDAGLCACIQQAADRTLHRSEQRRAARFFEDPHQAQEVRMSKSAADNEFWARYRGFADMAQAFCAR
jgi:hypothetical protein